MCMKRMKMYKVVQMVSFNKEFDVLLKKKTWGKRKVAGIQQQEIYDVKNGYKEDEKTAFVS